MTPEDAPEDRVAPLLDWVLRRHPETPKTRAKQWVLAGRVRVRGVIMRRPQERMSDPGDALELLDREPGAVDCGTGWQIHPQLALLYLDAALAVVNKGPGLISVPAPNRGLSALSILAEFLAGRLKARDRGIAGTSLPPAYRRLAPLPVHRLDQYTSGVFCMATNPGARARLIEQLKARTMKREYVAFVEGRLAARAGTWCHWLRLSGDELRQRIVPDTRAKAGTVRAKAAVTHYEVMAEYLLSGGQGLVSKLRLRLETGRKHQIRVQAAAAGVPLVGDLTYHWRERGDKRTGPAVAFPRQALHAELLSLEHPDRPGARMSWTAEWPEDLRRLEAALRRGRA